MNTVQLALHDAESKVMTWKEGYGGRGGGGGGGRDLDAWGLCPA